MQGHSGSNGQQAPWQSAVRCPPPPPPPPPGARSRSAGPAISGNGPSSYGDVSGKGGYHADSGTSQWRGGGSWGGSSWGDSSHYWGDSNRSWGDSSRSWGDNSRAWGHSSPYGGDDSTMGGCGANGYGSGNNGGRAGGAWGSSNSGSAVVGTDLKIGAAVSLGLGVNSTATSTSFIAPGGSGSSVVGQDAKSDQASAGDAGGFNRTAQSGFQNDSGAAANSKAFGSPESSGQQPQHAPAQFQAEPSPIVPGSAQPPAASYSTPPMKQPPPVKGPPPASVPLISGMTRPTITIQSAAGPTITIQPKVAVVGKTMPSTDAVTAFGAVGKASVMALTPPSLEQSSLGPLTGAAVGQSAVAASSALSSPAATMNVVGPSGGAEAQYGQALTALGPVVGSNAPASQTALHMPAEPVSSTSPVPAFASFRQPQIMLPPVAAQSKSSSPCGTDNNGLLAAALLKGPVPSATTVPPPEVHSGSAVSTSPAAMLQQPMPLGMGLASQPALQNSFQQPSLAMSQDQAVLLSLASAAAGRTSQLGLQVGSTPVTVAPKVVPPPPPPPPAPLQPSVIPPTIQVALPKTVSAVAKEIEAQILARQAAAAPVEQSDPSKPEPPSPAQVEASKIASATALPVVLQRIGADSIVSTWAGRGALKSVRHLEGRAYACVELLGGGTLHAPVERAVSYEVVGKRPPRKRPVTSDKAPSLAAESAVRERPQDSALPSKALAPESGAASAQKSQDEKESVKADLKAEDAKIQQEAKLVIGQRAEAPKKEEEEEATTPKKTSEAAEKPEPPIKEKVPSPAEKKGEEAKPKKSTPPACPEIGEIGADERAILGEWRHIEKIVTVCQVSQGLSLVVDTAKAPMLLERKEDKLWHARGDKPSEVTELRFDGKNAIQVKHGADAFFAHRVAQSKTLQGKWVHGGKSITVDSASPTEAGGSGLVLRTTDNLSMFLLRRALMEWEARHFKDRDLVYVVEHCEGTEKIVIRRPDGGSAAKGVEFRSVSAGGSPAKVADSPQTRAPPKTSATETPPASVGASIGRRSRSRPGKGRGDARSRSRQRGARAPPARRGNRPARRGDGERGRNRRGRGSYSGSDSRSYSYSCSCSRSSSRSPSVGRRKKDGGGAKKGSRRERGREREKEKDGVKNKRKKESGKARKDKKEDKGKAKKRKR